MTDVREENEAREEDGDHCKGIAMSNGQGNRTQSGVSKEDSLNQHWALATISGPQSQIKTVPIR